ARGLQPAALQQLVGVIGDLASNVGEVDPIDGGRKLTTAAGRRRRGRDGPTALVLLDSHGREHENRAEVARAEHSRQQAELRGLLTVTHVRSQYRGDRDVMGAELPGSAALRLETSGGGGSAPHGTLLAATAGG